MNILEIVADLKIGGAQRVAANISKYAGPEFHFTYAVFGDDVGDYEKEITGKGHRVVHIPSPKQSSAAFSRALEEVMHSEKYDVVHCHTMYSCGLVMMLAKRNGIPGRISHSHTAKDNARDSAKRKMYKKGMRDLIWHFGTDYLACGTDAGIELYGEKRFREKGIVIKNGIDTAAYRYNEGHCASIRRQLNLTDRFIIGHVGHYEPVKNQIFLIRLMPEILKHRPNAVLLLYGEGSTRSELEEDIQKLDLTDSAFVMGNANNIPEILSAFDVFAFPSLFEGTPLALLEAQANGLPCVISDQVPDDACVTELIQKLSLDDPAAWAKAILSAERDPKTDHTAALLSHYEDIHASMNKLYQIFDQYKNRR